MQNPIKIFLLVIAVLSACSKKEHAGNFERKDSFEKVSVGQSNQETMIPSELWDRLEQFYTSSGQTIEERIAEQGSKQKKIEVPVVFMPLRVFLTEKTSGSLGGQNFQINLDQGGGTLDLKSFVKKDRRSFYFAIEMGEAIEAGLLKVFFVSNANEAVIKKENYGAGCGKYMDITSFYQNTISKNGIELSTAGNRYIHVIAGTYVFALVKNASLYLSQVSITDSRFNKTICRN